MEFKLLGPLEASDGPTPIDLGGRKQRALLARLLLDANRTVATDRLVDDLWGEEVPSRRRRWCRSTSRSSARSCRRDLVRTHPPGYAIEIDPAAIDLVRFERLRREGEAAHAAGNADLAAERLREALALWRGDPLVEFQEPFARVEAARLAELHLACIEARIDADLDRGRHTELVAELDALVARHPLREGLRARQLLALYRSGRQSEALSSYQAFRTQLAEELGLEPSAELKEIERQILRHDSHLDLEAPAPSPHSSVPEVQYVTSGDISIAYQVLGDGHGRPRLRPRVGLHLSPGVGASADRELLQRPRLDRKADPVRQARDGALGPSRRGGCARGADGRRARGDGRGGLGTGGPGRRLGRWPDGHALRRDVSGAHGRPRPPGCVRAAALGARLPDRAPPGGRVVAEPRPAGVGPADGASGRRRAAHRLRPATRTPIAGMPRTSCEGRAPERPPTWRG